MNGAHDAPFSVDFDTYDAAEREAIETGEAPHYPAASQVQLKRAAKEAISLLDGVGIAAPLPDLDYLVREIGLVADGGAPHLLAGYGFSGKTLAAQSMALGLASGKPVWGAFKCQPRRVLHVDLEQGDRLTRRRYQRLALAMDVNLASLGDALSVAVMPPLTIAEEHADAWARLMAGRDLVIVDSLRAATAGADENSSEIRAGLDMLGHASEKTGCRALVVHHSRKPREDDQGGRYSIRGSSAIYDAVDAAYIFTAAKGEPVSVENVKARSHGDLAEDWALVIRDVEHDADPRAGLEVVLRGIELVREQRKQATHKAMQVQTREDADKVRRAVAAHPGLGTRELRAMVRPMSVDRFDAALVALHAAVDVREEHNPKGRATRRHYLRHPA